jgi:hypothetical protein
MDRVHIFPAARSKAQMVQPEAPLVERLVLELRGDRRYGDTGSSADAVKIVRGVAD